MMTVDLYGTGKEAMEISARNSLKGTVKKVVPGSVNTEVTIEVAPGVEIVSIITKSSADKLALAEGKIAYAVVKSSDVIIAVD
jgi:molybdopterin-binding protein